MKIFFLVVYGAFFLCFAAFTAVFFLRCMVDPAVKRAPIILTGGSFMVSYLMMFHAIHSIWQLEGEILLKDFAVPSVLMASAVLVHFAGILLSNRFWPMPTLGETYKHLPDSIKDKVWEDLSDDERKQVADEIARGKK